MYNSIYPININYAKANPYKSYAKGQNAPASDSGLSSNSKKTDTFTPSSNRINISQILMDFRNTILAINAPQDVQDEVNIYLTLVEKESQKDNPSRDIVISNLKNASRISDGYITSALGKPSNVVEGWISTIFRQDINLKSNPDEINPDFLLKFPQKAQDKIASAEKKEITQTQNEQVSTENIQEKPEESDYEGFSVTQLSDNSISKVPDEKIEVESIIDVSPDEPNIFIEQPQQEKITPFSPHNEDDARAKVLYLQAKKVSSTPEGAKDALNMLNEALGLMDESANSNIRAAIHFERGRIFDEYDYVDFALRDYFEATKASDLNLKANAFYKAGLLYDEFREYNPALDNFFSSVAYSGEADNLSAQSRVLSRISQVYASIYDIQNTQNYADLAIDVALDSQNSSAIADTYSNVAQNFQHLGDKKQALENYKNALAEFSRENESYEKMAYNYSQASLVMRELGNEAKAKRLEAKANQYYQKAQLQRDSLELAS